MTRTNWTAEEIDGVTIEWLCDLTFAGRTIRTSTAALIVTSYAGDLAYDAARERK